ncbi:apoptosis-stimulating of p53 protein 2 isoform X2 [Neocloeon triangulifer]|uniref:apoptosis-stimulating of p53 protein 2 isoform X2 n=1 Tax=Neocloeon triangulifer TaxID=2078957 RepID=UPI00286F06D3|nr:apoptosis-stimulating of p53 protein 2 isoform X2 [Neocloeon triangulifer]
MQPAIIPVIIRVFGEGGAATDVPVTPETTCRDLVECTRDPGDEDCCMVELWRDCERTLREDDRPLEILQEWGCHRDEVKFVLRYTVAAPAQQSKAPRKVTVRSRKRGARNNSPSNGGMKEPGPLCDLLPEGAGLTLSELREMAGRQQRQIDSQRQLLAAKEQRLLFLKQQDARSHAAAAEQERLRRLRARVEAQELKLRKLRALRGQVDQQRGSNGALTSDLDSIRALFNEKEKELCMAVAKVEELTRQLEEVKRGRAASAGANNANNGPSVAALELEKLRRELMYRNKLNEQQSQKLSQQRDAITARHDEMARIDARISELQERLHRKRILNQQLASQLAQQQAGGPQVLNLNSAAPRASSRPNIAAVEPFLRRRNPPLAPEAPPPQLSKSDPKYQTLPYNTKFAASLAAGRAANKAAELQNNQDQQPHLINNNNNVNNNNNYNNMVNLVHSAPAVANAKKGHAIGMNQEQQESNANQHQQQQQQQQRLQSGPAYVPPPPPPAGSRGQPVGGSGNGARGSHRLSGAELALNVASMVQQVAGASHPPHAGQPQQQQEPVTSTPSTPLSTQQRPVSSVAPSVVTTPNQQQQAQQPHAQKPSPIYQGKTQTTGAVPQNLTLSPPQSTSTPIGTPEVNPESTTAKTRPALPPKPAPPPRLLQQILQQQQQNSQQNAPNEEPNSPPPPPATDPPAEEPSTPPGKRQNIEQPKLKASVASNRRIEMPPAFLFPENEPPPADLSPHLADPPLKETSVDEPDRVMPNEEKMDNVDLMNNINQEHLSGEQLVKRARKGGLKMKGASKAQAAMRRVSFDPLALLLDASLEGELELVKRTATQVTNPSAANDEGITALHNAICAGHFEIVKFLVQFGCDVNAQDSDGWTPLHCAASCNNLAMVKFLVEHGACIFATTHSDIETAAEKCEEDEEGFDGCSEYLYSVQEKLGILNQGAVYAVYDYEAHNTDELSFNDGDQLVVLRKGDELEREWWWSKIGSKEGYVPRNLLGLYPRVKPSKVE